MPVFSKMARAEPFLFLEIDTHFSDSTNQDVAADNSTDSSLNSITKNVSVDTIITITYDDYMKRPDILSKSTLSVLKSTAQHLSTKSYRVHKHGNKPELIERIRRHFDKCTKATLIQRQYRKYLAKCVLRLRGPGYTHLSKCVNDSDFFTMDPLSEIDRRHFYSYMDSKGFVYGFDVFSLMNLFKREHKIVNPYTREELDASRVRDIFSLFQKIYILYPDSCGGKYIQIPAAMSPKRTRNDTRTRMTERMNALQQLPANQRMTELFMEIDRLGNYTQSAWFSGLSKEQYIRFYVNYFTWWNRLPASTKREVCYIANPFSDIRYRPLDEVERHEYQEACLALMEHMVYTGVNEESRKLGALHVLTQLTRVSYLARLALPWLYESISI
jgi:hypothetical protein